MEHSPEEKLVETDIHVQATYRLTEALVSAEQKMRRRVELLSEVIFEIDGCGRLMFLNQAWHRVTGFGQEESLGRPMAEFVLPEDLERFNGSLGRESAQIRFRHSNGNALWMECAATALLEGGFVGALRDITRQKAAQDELAKLSMVACHTDNLVIITDRNGSVEWVNHAFVRRTGFSEAEVLGRKPGSFLQGPETDPATVAQIRDWLHQESSFRCELVNYTKSGEPYWVSMYVTPIRDAEGHLVRYISVQTDCTAIRTTRHELEIARQHAEAASLAKTLFLGTISHEMRTPLHVILGATELALEEDTVADCRAHLKRISESGETLLRLISDLLDVSKIEAGQIEFERKRFRLHSCIRRAVDPVAEAATRKGLEFRFLCDGFLPEYVLSDPARLRQILSNLLENAVKFTDRGFVRVEVFSKTDALRGEAWLEIQVSDSGIGIPADEQRRVFERFAQVNNSTNRPRGGAGLGLSIVKSLVEAMRGSITLESSVGMGTRFTVRLPLALGEEVSPVSHTGQPLETTVRPSRILIAEDFDPNYVILERRLTKAGYLVRRAENGSEALKAASTEAWDLILMDVEMPQMDGLEATRLIRMFEQENGAAPTPIVALTAHAVKGYREKCLEAGCTGYLSKPVRKPELLDAVAGALQQGSARSRTPD